jgi:hypothetical protein
MACVKTIDFELNETEPKLVIEANIENGQPPLVILTNSINYFSNISPEILARTFVHDADVYVSNGIKTHRLKEYSFPAGGGIMLYYYSIDSSDLATSFTGTLNTTYTLRIVSGGKEYNSTTMIPSITKRIDSIWWKPLPAVSDSNKAAVIIRLTDPPGYGDYIRYFTKRNREPFYPAVNSVFDDLFIDGTTYEVQVQPGVDRNIDSADVNFFRRGDTVVFKISNIDKATFNFWRTFEYSYAVVGDPFSTPVKVLSNIRGDALGYFGGYASQYHTLIIPR